MKKRNRLQSVVYNGQSATFIRFNGTNVAPRTYQPKRYSRLRLQRLILGTGGCRADDRIRLGRRHK